MSRVWREAKERWRFATAMAPLVLGALACTTGDLPEATIDTWTLSTAPLVTIGGNDSGLGQDLYWVRFASRLSDGRIAVANTSTDEVRYYDAAGTYLYAAGGEGDGPGELRTIWQMERLPGDTILTFSTRPGLTWYAPDSTFTRSQAIDIFGMARFHCRFAEGNWRLLPDFTVLFMLDQNDGVPGCPPTPEGVHHHTALLARKPPGGEVMDTVAVLPSGEWVGNYPRVYGPQLAVDTGADRIYAAYTGGEEILALSFDGDTIARFPMPFEARPVPPEAKSERAPVLTMSDGREVMGTPYDYAEVFPRIHQIKGAEDGTLWVMAYPEGTAPSSFLNMRTRREVRDLWRVLDQQGSVIAEVRTPPGFTPLEIGPDYVLGLEVDALSVESVVMYGLSRG